MLKLKTYCFIALSFCYIVTNAQSQLNHKIDSILKKYATNNKPGLAISIIHNNDVLYSKGFGISNLDYSIKNTDSTVFSLASISKQFTAAAVWALIEEGKLSLDDNLSQFFPSFPDYSKSIKIEHLLNHTSGFRNYHTLMYLSGFDYDRDYYDNQTVLNLASRQKNLDHIPGEKISYSNTNYNILALIIEQLSGQNLNDFLQSKVLLPLGMTNTFVRVSHGKVIKNKAVGYQNQDDNYIYNVSNQLSYGAGSMGSNALDMSIWLNMLNTNIPEFKELATFLKTAEILTTGKKASYGRGLLIDDYKGYQTYSHSGFGFGGQTQLVVVPNEKIGVIIMTNLQTINPTPISYQILDMMLISDASTTLSISEKQSNEINESIVFQIQDLKQFVGDYIEINSDMVMHITKENDTLKARSSMGKVPIPLLQNDKNLFVRRDSQNVKYDFTKIDQYDMIVSFGGTPFYFKRAKINTENPFDLSNFVGNYFSEELESTYHFYTEDDMLKLEYKNHENISLYPIQINKFGNQDRTLYHFTTNKDGKIIGMLLSCDGQVSNIEFLKIKANINP